MAIRVTTGHRPQETETNYPLSPFRLFEDMFNDWAVRSAQKTAETWRPAVDVFEKEGNLILKMELSGVDEKSIDLKLDGAVLTIKGEKKLEESESYTCHQSECHYGPFSRSFNLPDSADPEQITAKFKNGVLTVTIPQKAEVKPRTIKVTT
jgi:HSP20 family protein